MMFFTRKYKNLIKENNSILKQLCTNNGKQNSNERFIELNKTYLKVVNHWFWDEYDKTGWEPETYNTYKNLLTLDCTYVDIGAWVGMTTFYAAEMGVKKLYAVEANPLTYDLTKKNFNFNKITKNVILDNLCITNKDNTLVDFGGKEGADTSSASSIRGNAWKVPSKTLYSYLIENDIINDNLFIKIDIEGAEELILEDLDRLCQKENLTIYLSPHPSFMKNKEKTCEKLLEICSKFKQILSSDLKPLSCEKLKEMLLTEEKYPFWGTKFGNFFEITLTNNIKIDYKKYWINDNCNNIIPLTGEYYPEGWDPCEIIKNITNDYPYEKVLDFGCGYGRLSKAFDSNKYIGIDLNPNALALARERNIGYKYEETFVDMENYPEADIGVAYTVFLHLDDETLDNILSKLLNSVQETFIIAEILGREWRRGGKPPVFCREKTEYENIMKKYGFNLVNEIRKPYECYVKDPAFKNKLNKDLSFLIFKKTQVFKEISE